MFSSLIGAIPPREDFRIAPADERKMNGAGTLGGYQSLLKET
jgi:hypothetical protein